MRNVLYLSACGAVGCVGPWPGSPPTDSGAGPGLIDEARVAMELPGPIGDHGWSYAHNEGLKAIADELGADTRANEAVAAGDLAARIDQDVADGFNVVYTASSDYISITQQKAVEYPDVYFVSCCGQVYNDNLTSYFGRMYQPLFLAGYMAGKLAASERLGVVASKPFPEFVRHIDAFTLGARAANPRAVVDIRWVDSFFDPPVETQHTNDLLDLGADVILTQTDTTIMVTEVEARRRDGDETVYSIGYDNPESCEAGPTGCIASAHWNWGPLYVRQIRSLLDGSWDPRDVGWQPMTNDADSIVNLGTPAAWVPVDVTGEMTDYRADLVAEPAQPFVGPIRDVTGAVRVAAGVELSDEEMDRLCWFVDGVIDSSGGADVPATVPSGCVGDF